MSERRPWSRGDLEEARLLQRELGELLRIKPFTNESMHAVTKICDRAMVTVDDDYCQEMFCMLDRQAHQQFATGKRNRGALKTALDAIDQRLGSLETLRGAGQAVARAEAILAKS